MKDPREPYTFQENLEYERSIDMSRWVEPPPHTGLEPDSSDGAFVGCDCWSCREFRLRDHERIGFTAHDLGMAYQSGYLDAMKRCQEKDDG